MNKFTAWLKERKSEISLAAKHWPPIIKNSIISSLIWWAGALGLVFIATLVALAITYKNQGEVEMSDYFPPNFWWGFLIVLAVIFMYQIIVETANSIDKYRVGADKFTWNDVSKTIRSTPLDRPDMVCLQVSNNKPYDIQKGIVKIIRIEKDRFPLPLGNLPPMNLSWITDRGQTWGGRKLHRNGEAPRILAIAGWLDPNRKPVLMTGYAEENSTGAGKYLDLEVDSNYLITFQWFGEIDGHPMDAYHNSYKLRFDGEKFHFSETILESIIGE